MENIETVINNDHMSWENGRNGYARIDIINMGTERRPRYTARMQGSSCVGGNLLSACPPKGWSAYESHEYESDGIDIMAWRYFGSIPPRAIIRFCEDAMEAITGSRSLNVTGIFRNVC